MDSKTIIGNYQNYLWTMEYGKGTIKAYVATVNLFVTHIPKLFDEVAVSDFDEFFLKQKENSNSKKSLARHASALENFFKYLYDRAIISADLSEKVPKFKVLRDSQEERNKKPIKMKELGKLFDYCKENESIRNNLMFRLTLKQCLRAGETIALRVCDFDFDTHMIIVRNAKGGKTRTIPMVDRTLFMAIQRYIKEKKLQPSDFVFDSKQSDQMSYCGFLKNFQTACERAGVNKYKLHQLRHTGATILYEDGLKIKELSDILGHSNTSTTEVYLNIAPNNIHTLNMLHSSRLAAI